MASSGQLQQVDVDELAREKVQEVERLLDSTENHKVTVVNQWFSILKQIITAADLHRTNDKNDRNESNKETKIEPDDSIYADYADDNEQFNAVDITEQFATNSVKWTIRVRAFKLVHRLVHTLTESGKSLSSKTPLLRQLPDLVRLSFVAATSPYDDLKIQGFEMFKFLINRFASVEEKEFPGVSILYQYRTQVLSALKPAFNLDAPPYITAIASQVCCLWICRGFEKDPINLKRTYQLMLSTIEKLENQSINQHSKLYTECELEQERLDILGSWAQLYITAKESGNVLPAGLRRSNLFGFETNHLNELVKDQINSLIDKWWEALKDYALLIMPAPRIIGTLHEHENVYTREVALRLFGPVWPKIVMASSIWLCSDSFENRFGNVDKVPQGKDNGDEDCDTCNDKQHISDSQIKYFKFICGIIMRELCSCNSNDQVQIDSLPESSIFVIKSLSILVSNESLKSTLVEDLAVGQEFYSILYCILINRTRAKSSCHLLLHSILENIFNLIVKRMADKPSAIKASLAYLGDQVKVDIVNINNASSNDSPQDTETIKTNLLIRLSNTLNIMKLVPESDMTQSETLIEVFRLAICNEYESSIGITLLELLKDFYSNTSSLISQQLINNLFTPKRTMVTKFFSLIGYEGTLEKDKLAQCLLYLDIYLKSMRDDISLVTDNDILLKEYIQVLVDHLPKTSDKSFVVSSRKKDLLDLSLKHIKDLDAICHDRFESFMVGDIRQAYESALDLQSEIKSESEAKRNKAIPRKPASAVPIKPPTKITLKADFSNFYAKKS